MPEHTWIIRFGPGPSPAMMLISSMSFFKERKATNPFSEAAALVRLKGLSKCALSIAPLNKCTAQDINKGINAIEKTGKQNTGWF